MNFNAFLIQNGRRERSPAVFYNANGRRRRLQLGGNGIEGGADLAAQRGDGTDDDDGNKGGNQRVFDGGDSALVELQLAHFHGERGTDIIDEHGKILFRLMLTAAKRLHLNKYNMEGESRLTFSPPRSPWQGCFLIHGN